MGDRGNIVIVDEKKEPKIYFYSHWTGSRLPIILAQALKNGKERWGDDSYLNRVIFQTLLEGHDGIIGYGIDFSEGDGGTELYVCHKDQTVTYKNKVYTFEEFIAIDHKSSRDEEEDD